MHTEEIEFLSEAYVREGAIPRKNILDAYHIAYATAYGIDAIVSWNFKHIVKLKTKKMVNGINLKLGYHEVEICSPEEVV